MEAAIGRQSGGGICALRGEYLAENAEASAALRRREQRVSIEAKVIAGQAKASMRFESLLGEAGGSVMNPAESSAANDLSGAEFARLLVQYDRELLRYILSFLPRRDDAEEVLQRAATVLWEKFGQYDRNREFLPWALKFTYFEVLNFRKERARSRLIFRDDLMESLAATRELQGTILEARRMALRRCLRRLKPDDLELLWRRYGNTDTIAALAEELGRTSKSMYRRLDRIRELVARCVERSTDESAVV